MQLIAIIATTTISGWRKEGGEKVDEVYTDRFVTVSILSEEEANEYRNMTPGVSITDEMIRCVAENGEEKQIIEVTAN